MAQRPKGHGRANPTLEQVARLAGVSIATASRVVTGAVPVSPDRRARVERAIAELSYVPDERARDLRRATTRTVGIVVPSLESPLHGEVFRLVHRALQRGGSTVLVFESDDDRDAERAAVEVLVRSHARAVVVAAAAGLAPDAMQMLRRRDIRVVFFGDRPPDPRQACVCVDDYGGSRLLTEHLIALGHRRIALLGGALDGSTGLDRRAGHVAALADAGIAADPDLLAGDGWTLSSGQAAAARLLDLPDPPTAILASHPVLAAGALLVVRDRGLRIPEDLSLASFFESDHIRYVTPAITCLTDVGAGMAGAIVDAIGRRDAGVIDVPLVASLRPSTGPPPARGPVSR
jgi:DNA-binding LacI/PurR family transcriptional regulator